MAETEHESTDSWNADECADLVEELHGSENAVEAKAAGQALVREAVHAGFHARRVRELHESIDTNRHSDPGRAVMILMGHAAEGLESGRSFAETRFAAGAHLMACVRCLHVSIDLSAAVLYHALDLRGATGGKLTIRRVYLNTVAKVLEDSVGHAELRSGLHDFMDEPSVVYVRDLSNASKHRTLIRTPFKVALRFDGSSSPYGLHIDAFIQDEREYPAKAALEFVEVDYPGVVKPLIGLMRMLDKSLNSIVEAGA